MKFEVNDHLSLKLESDKTIIYVAGERFNQCKYLLLIIQDKIATDIGSIDEVAEISSKALEIKVKPVGLGLAPEQEFMAHCSNLQAWAEHDYDTRLLHSNLAFPLLKALKEVNDGKARKAYGKEIINRFLKGTEKIRKFLLDEDYVYEISFADQLDLFKKIDLSKNEYSLLKRILFQLDYQWAYEKKKKAKNVMKELISEYFIKGENKIKKYLSRFLSAYASSAGENGDEIRDDLYKIEELLILYETVVNEREFILLKSIIKEIYEKTGRIMIYDDDFKSSEGKIVYLEFHFPAYQHNTLVRLPDAVYELEDLKHLRTYNIKLPEDVRNKLRVLKIEEY